MNQLAEEILRIADSSSELKFEKLPKDDPLIREPDITFAHAALGWSPKVELDEGLLSTVSYFRNELKEE